MLDLFIRNDCVLRLEQKAVQKLANLWLSFKIFTIVAKKERFRQGIIEHYGLSRLHYLTIIIGKHMKILNF